MLIRPFAHVLASVVLTLPLSGCVHNPAAANVTTATSSTEPASTVAAPPGVAGAARVLAGKWRCSGAVHGPEGEATSEVTVDIALDRQLDQAWLETAFAVSSGKYRYKFDSRRTFDASANKWVNMIVDNLGGHAVSSSADGVVWTGQSSGPMGETKIMDTETIVSSGKMKLLGQYSTDGSSWKIGYDLFCEK